MVLWVIRRWLRIWVSRPCGYRGLVGLMPYLGCLCPSKSGLINKHIVKHIIIKMVPSRNTPVPVVDVSRTAARLHVCRQGVDRLYIDNGRQLFPNRRIQRHFSIRTRKSMARAQCDTGARIIIFNHARAAISRCFNLGEEKVPCRCPLQKRSKRCTNSKP
jgi:hypothetical protein